MYITTEASLPMAAALVHGGLGIGPAMAFIVAGPVGSQKTAGGSIVIACYSFRKDCVLNSVCGA